MCYHILLYTHLQRQVYIVFHETYGRVYLVSPTSPLYDKYIIVIILGCFLYENECVYGCT